MKYKKILPVVLSGSLILSAGILSGCGSAPRSGQSQPQTVKVNTLNPFRTDTPIMREYSGTVVALQELPVRAKVSGTVIEKYIQGGEQVVTGQPLYRIDTRAYSSAFAAAQANAAQAEAVYENAKSDLSRYEMLVQSGAVSKQVYERQKSATESYRAAYEAARSQVQMASDNLGDTIVTAPFSGTLSMDDVNVGTFVTAGQTPMVTISSTDPLYVQFDMSESEYLQLKREKSGTGTLGNHLKLRLSDGSIYEEPGSIVQVSPGLSGGQLTMKASFANPRSILVPGMYATVISDAEVSKDSILVPTKAILQLLNKDILDVVVDGKVQQKSVKVGATYGIYSIIENGITENTGGASCRPDENNKRTNGRVCNESNRAAAWR